MGGDGHRRRQTQKRTQHRYTYVCVSMRIHHTRTHTSRPNSHTTSMPPRSFHAPMPPSTPPPPPTLQKQADAEIHSKLSQLSKAFLLAERAIPVLPLKKPKEGQQEPAAAQEEKEAEGEGEEGPKTVQFIGPGEQRVLSHLCSPPPRPHIHTYIRTHRKRNRKNRNHNNDNAETPVIRLPPTLQPPPPPVEWKGIKGADGRCYMLDLLRLTPRDANWIKEDWQKPSGSGTGVWERAGCVRGSGLGGGLYR